MMLTFPLRTMDHTPTVVCLQTVIHRCDSYQNCQMGIEIVLAGPLSRSSAMMDDATLLGAATIWGIFRRALGECLSSQSDVIGFALDDPWRGPAWTTWLTATY
ncbi:hypothetical protein V2G26_013739 [Clonostachys chloroleuca]